MIVAYRRLFNIVPIYKPQVLNDTSLLSKMPLRNYFLILCLVAAAYPKSVTKRDLAKEELEEYIAAKRLELNPRYRQHYHVSPPVGWMNDPNGFSYYKGEYHIFYQFHPYDSVPGPMHWGHSKSPNIVDWQMLPTALLPEEEQVFSGSGIVDGDTLILMYTGHLVSGISPFYNESQYLAFSDDGIEFHKYEGNPVLPAAPNGSPDFRDPKVWKHGEHYYVIIGSKTDDLERGRVLLYRSLDMINWEFLRILGETGITGDFGYMWECPDFFELDGRFVLLWSPEGMEPQGDRYKNQKQTGYIIGIFNYETFEFIPEVEFQELDFGHNVYASQSAEIHGKRYQVAWFNSWDDVYPEAEDGWSGTLTLFRELSLHGDRILAKPVDEILTLRDGLVMNGDLDPQQVLELGKTGEVLIDADLEEKIEILLEGRNGGTTKVWLRWDPAVGKVVVDRDGDVRQVEWSPIGSHTWRLFLDASSLELFCGEGEVVFSSRAYPDGNWNLTNLSPQPLNVEAYNLRRSVPV